MNSWKVSDTFQEFHSKFLINHPCQKCSGGQECDLPILTTTTTNTPLTITTITHHLGLSHDFSNDSNNSGQLKFC